MLSDWFFANKPPMNNNKAATSNEARENYFQKLGTPQQLYKRDYHSLADALPLDQLDAEVLRVLDEIVTVAKQATPRQ